MRSVSFSFLAICLIFLLSSHKPNVTGNLKVSFSSYDVNKGPWEQPNPIFRWPLPEVAGEAYINAQFVVVSTKESVLISEELLKETGNFIQEIYNEHNLYLNFKEAQDFEVRSLNNIRENWKSILPSKENQLTIYVLSGDHSEADKKELYASNDIVTNRIIVPFGNQQEVNVYAAKSLSHALGLLPTYFENLELGVPAEDAANCGFAGDFVCDTPFDHFGLKNDVKQKNCRYKGELGEPDVRNLMSNSWAECLDHITIEQGNKLKYNLSVIPMLQTMLSQPTTIKLNIGIIDNETINQVTLK